MAAQFVEDGLQEVLAEAAACLTVGGGTQRRFAALVAACEHPGADLADDFLARHGGVEHLEEEVPEECHRWVKALAFGFRIGCFGEKVRRQQTANQSGQIGQRQVTELLQLVDDAAGGGGLRTSLKRAREVGQKTGEERHEAGTLHTS